MPTYTVKLYGTAQVTATVKVEASSDLDAKNKVCDPEVLGDVVWKYDGLEKLTSVNIISVRRKQ